MRLFILFAIAARVSARLENSESAPEVASNEVPILASDFQKNSEGQYRFGYVTGDGSRREEQGIGGVQVTGSYSYIAPDGQEIQVTYVADEKGFRPVGNVIPQQVQQAVFEQAENPGPQVTEEQVLWASQELQGQQPPVWPAQDFGAAPQRPSAQPLVQKDRPLKSSGPKNKPGPDFSQQGQLPLTSEGWTGEGVQSLQFPPNFGGSTGPGAENAWVTQSPKPQQFSSSFGGPSEDPWRTQSQKPPQTQQFPSTFGGSSGSDPWVTQSLKPQKIPSNFGSSSQDPWKTQSQKPIPQTFGGSTGQDPWVTQSQKGPQSQQSPSTSGQDPWVTQGQKGPQSQQFPQSFGGSSGQDPWGSQSQKGPQSQSFGGSTGPASADPWATQNSLNQKSPQLFDESPQPSPRPPKRWNRGPEKGRNPRPWQQRLPRDQTQELADVPRELGFFKNKRHVKAPRKKSWSKVDKVKPFIIKISEN